MSVFTVLTPPTIEPVSVTDIEAELKLGAGQTDRLQEMLEAAIYQLQVETDRQLCAASLVLTMDRFPSCGEIELLVKPVTSITHIKYYDTDNVLQTLASTNYRLITLTSPAVIERTQTGTWYSTYDRADAVQVTFVAGESNKANVPIAAKRAIKGLVEHTYTGLCSRQPWLMECIASLKWSGL